MPSSLTANPPTWAATVFSARESLADQLAGRFRENADKIPANVDLQVWSIALPDKAGTRNQYLHELWPEADLTFFIDGYVNVRQNALGLLADFLETHPAALSATGLPSYGRSAKQFRQEILRNGGLHGNLYALPKHTVKLLREHPFNLPLGIYRNDSLLGAALAFALDPAAHEWGPKERLGVCEQASWFAPEKAWWRLSDLSDQWRRRKRQVRGQIENTAIRQHLSGDKRPPSEIPVTVTEWIQAWAEAHPDQVKQLCRFSPGHRRALTELLRAKDWSLAAVPPRLMLQINGRPGE